MVREVQSLVMMKLFSEGMVCDDWGRRKLVHGPFFQECKVYRRAGVKQRYRMWEGDKPIFYTHSFQLIKFSRVNANLKILGKHAGRVKPYFVILSPLYCTLSNRVMDDSPEGYEGWVHCH